MLCAERVGQMTKTYNDIDAVTRLLEEVSCANLVHLHLNIYDRMACCTFYPFGVTFNVCDKEIFPHLHLFKLIRQKRMQLVKEKL